MEQIEVRLQFIPTINQAIERLLNDWQEGQLLFQLAQERVLQLAIEAVTDVCSYMIDGLMMREASSYEDMITILYDEQVYDNQTKDVLMQLVEMRRLLVQQYYAIDRHEGPHYLLPQLQGALSQFSKDVRVFLKQELQDFS